MPSNTASGWWIASTGPSATTPRSASVMRVAISRMVLRSGSSPDISRSIQIRFASLGSVIGRRSGQSAQRHCQRRRQSLAYRGVDGQLLEGLADGFARLLAGTRRQKTAHLGGERLRSELGERADDVLLQHRIELGGDLLPV